MIMKQDLNAPRRKLSLKQKEDDLVVDLNNNNNNVNKTEAPTPQRQRKATFGPFETSYEEETPDEPNLLKAWDPIMEPFTNNPLDYWDN